MGMERFLSGFGRDQRGATATLFGVMLVPLAISMAAAVDYTRIADLPHADAGRRQFGGDPSRPAAGDAGDGGSSRAGVPCSMRMPGPAPATRAIRSPRRAAASRSASPPPEPSRRCLGRSWGARARDRRRCGRRHRQQKDRACARSRQYRLDGEPPEDAEAQGCVEPAARQAAGGGHCAGRREGVDRSLRYEGADADVGRFSAAGLDQVRAGQCRKRRRARLELAGLRH